MRLWSLHPRFLDSRRLVALWREALLAKHVLKGKTDGYRNHPQLIRFRNSENPIAGINQYLKEIFIEADRRGFAFDDSKVSMNVNAEPMPVTDGQLDFEWNHLMKKLKKSDVNKYNQIKTKTRPAPHPLFYKIKGTIEDWEKGN